MKLLIGLLLFTSVCLGQKKDSVVVKADSITIVMSEFLTFLQDKITVKDYLPVQDMVNAYLKSKEFNKPKKK